MMPKTNSSLSASWELVFSRPRVVSCVLSELSYAGIVPRVPQPGPQAAVD